MRDMSSTRSGHGNLQLARYHKGGGGAYMSLYLPSDCRDPLARCSIGYPQPSRFWAANIVCLDGGPDWLRTVDFTPLSYYRGPGVESPWHKGKRCADWPTGENPRALMVLTRGHRAGRNKNARCDWLWELVCKRPTSARFSTDRVTASRA